MTDRELFAEMWFAGASVPEMAARLGCQPPAIYRLRIQYGLPNRPPVRSSKKDPTTSEIEERAAEVRARWSDEERERRAVGRVSGWGVPVATRRT